MEVLLEFNHLRPTSALSVADQQLASCKKHRVQCCPRPQVAAPFPAFILGRSTRHAICANHCIAPLAEPSVAPYQSCMQGAAEEGQALQEHGDGSHVEFSFATQEECCYIVAKKQVGLAHPQKEVVICPSSSPTSSNASNSLRWECRLARMQRYSSAVWCADIHNRKGKFLR